MHVVAPQGGRIRGWDRTDWGEEVAVDLELGQARPEAYDGLVLPGGQDRPTTHAVTVINRNYKAP